MATNVYESRQVISYSSDHEVSYYGWAVSFSGEQDQAHPFISEEARRDHLDAIRAAIAKAAKVEESDEYEAQLAAALVCLADDSGLVLNEDLEPFIEAIRDADTAWWDEKSLSFDRKEE